MARTFQELINGPVPVVVDFTATWCGPCKAMAPIIEQFKQQVGDAAVVLKVDVDANPAAAQYYRIQGVPTLAIFKAGALVWRHSGVLSASDLRAALQPHLA
jgi:thioredoxin 1